MEMMTVTEEQRWATRLTHLLRMYAIAIRQEDEITRERIACEIDNLYHENVEVAGTR